MSKLVTVLDQIDNGTMLLPEFQRGYVWNRNQVRGLMRSMYLDYPVGSLLVWETQADPGAVRGGTTTGGEVKRLLLDGQQRITTLYGIIRGRPPAFFEGNPGAFSGLRFNVESEVFEFYMPAKMKSDPRWVDLTVLFRDGIPEVLETLRGTDGFDERMVTYVTRLNRVVEIEKRDFHEERITGADKGFDVVVDIFNRVNSGGTKLSKGDLALAKICAQWPPARSQMREHLQKWRDGGYELSLDWLLRNVNAVATGRAPFSALETVGTDEFASALTETAGNVGEVLENLRGRLGLDHDRVLMGKYAIPVMVLHLHNNAGTFGTAVERDRWMYWFIHAALWGRFTGSTESVLARDYETLGSAGLDGLLTELERSRGGNLALGSHDFSGSTIGSRFYPMLYLMTRVLQAKDLCSGVPLHAQMLGHLGSLQVHHLFPKAQLRKHDYEHSEINAVANFAFLTQKCNLSISARLPEDYFAQVAADQPGALESQWIPTDPDLWRMERYRDFLAARRELLADAANQFLRELVSPDSGTSAVRELERMVVSERADDDRERDISAVVAQLLTWGYAEPTRDVEISDPESGASLAVAEAYWPDGLQVGQGPPVILELDPEIAKLEGLQRLGYEVFTTTSALHDYAARRNSQAAGE